MFWFEKILTFVSDFQKLIKHYKKEFSWQETNSVITHATFKINSCC
jgi:hypothetical protein